MSDWISIENGELPRLGARLIVFTPATAMELRYRMCNTEDLHYYSAATHWAYLSPPAEYFGHSA